MVLYASTDPWPDHPKPWYREVYKIARGHGWTLETHTSHSGSATVRCPSGDCSFKVFATGRGAESVAKQHKLMIKRCPHGPGTIDALTRATELLDKSERLLDALDSLHERDNLNNRVQALLVDNAALHEDEILDLWLAADGLTVEADELLAELGSSGQEQSWTPRTGHSAPRADSCARCPRPMRSPSRGPGPAACERAATRTANSYLGLSERFPLEDRNPVGWQLSTDVLGVGAVLPTAGLAKGDLR